MDGNSWGRIRNIVLSLMLGLAFILLAGTGSAQPQVPDDVEIYYPVDGWFCIRDVELGINFCELIDPCCNREPDCSILEPTIGPGSELTMIEPTLEPTIELTSGPTIEPTSGPTIEPTSEPTEEPRCNRGTGNGSENCDPGNSGGKPGSAGEDNE